MENYAYPPQDHRYTALDRLLDKVRDLIPPSDAEIAAALRELAAQDTARIGEFVDQIAGLQRDYAALLGEFLAVHGEEVPSPWAGPSPIAAISRYRRGAAGNGGMAR